MRKVGLGGQVKEILMLFGKARGLLRLVVIAILIALILGGVFFITLFGLVNAVLIGLILLFVAINIVIGRGLVRIDEVPNMYLGVPTHLGKRQCDYVINEGLAIVIPKIYGHIKVNMKMVNLDFTVTAMSDKNAKVNLDVAIGMWVDEENICEFLNAGGSPEGEEIHGTGQNGGQRGVADTVVDMVDSSFLRTCKKMSVPKIYEIPSELMVDAGKALFGKDAVQEEIEISSKTPHNVSGLGVYITKFVVKKGSSTIDAALEREALEEIERRYEKVDAGTQALLVKEFQQELERDGGDGVSKERIMMMLNEQRLAEKGVQITPGVSALLFELAEVLRKGGDLASIIKMFGKK